MNHILSYGTSTEDELLEELADEARRYLSLIEEMRDIEAEDEQDAAEEELYASITHIAGHGQLLLEHLDGLIDQMPEESPEESEETTA